MGASSSKKGLESAIKRTESRVGKIPVSGRYHRDPKKLEDDYVPDEAMILGSGYNGSVYMATSKLTQKRFAVKGFKLHGISREKKEELANECEIFLAMDHPHVARLVDVYESEEHLNLVMECMNGGEMFKRVEELSKMKKRYSETNAANAVYQMLLAINYIHSHGVVHRDLKLENFLYEEKNTDHLKLIDFGFSKVYEPNTKMALSCGTLSYVAPEVLEKNYTSQCDLWSLGVIVFILLLGYMPFSGSEEHQVRMIKSGKYRVHKEAFKKISEKAQDFLKKLLVVDPSTRMSAEQALNHPWIQGREQLVQDASVDEGTLSALVTFGQESTFRRACMSMMAWSLSNEERSQVRAAFLAMDTDRKGTITLNEFKQVLESHYHISDVKVLEAFKALDVNNTEEIHYSEFLAAMVSSRIALHDNLLKMTFARFDTDNTGFISLDNLREVLGDHFEGKEVEDLLIEADTSKDGLISYEEFINYLRGGEADAAHTDAAARIIDREIKDHPRDGAAPCRQKTSVKVGGSDTKTQDAQSAGRDSTEALQGSQKGGQAQKKQGCCVVQ